MDEDAVARAVQESARVIVDALNGQGINAEKRHGEVIRELRIINDSVRSMDTRHGERLNGIDEKLAEIADHGKRLLDKDLGT